MIEKNENYIKNISITFSFSDMRILPVFTKDYKQLSERGGVFDTWYAYKIDWLFVHIEPVWKYRFY